MFCPKCGNEVADGAGFCPKCGNQLGAPSTPHAQPGFTGAAPAAAPASAPAAQPQNAVPLSAPSFLNGFSGAQIAGIIASVVAIIFALMPWFETSQTLINAGNTASSISSFLTMGNYSTAHFEESYTMFAMMDFVDDLASYLSASSSSSRGGVFNILIPLWAIGLILMVVGAVLFALRKNKIALIIGAVLLIGVAIYFNLGFYQELVRDGWAVSCINSTVCAIASAAAIVLAILTKRPKAAKEKKANA